MTLGSGFIFRVWFWSQVVSGFFPKKILVIATAIGLETRCAEKTRVIQEVLRYINTRKPSHSEPFKPNRLFRNDLSPNCNYQKIGRTEPLHLQNQSEPLDHYRDYEPALLHHRVGSVGSGLGGLGVLFGKHFGSSNWGKPPRQKVLCFGEEMEDQGFWFGLV